MNAEIIVIAGPTASGKSDLALRLARARRSTIVNADAMQVYAELRTLTARPDDAELQAAPHCLYGHVSAAERYSVARWLGDAVQAIQTAAGQGRVPLVVGGTGLYLSALIDGFSPVPEISEETRQATAALWAELGAEGFHALLAERDPVMARRLNRADSSRTQRAWAVLNETGRSLADWQAMPKRRPFPKARFQLLALMPESATSAQRIERRFKLMLQGGALAEVEKLMALQLPGNLPAMKAVGVPELSAHLRGELTLEDASVAACLASRQLAKRQRTWIRTQLLPSDHVHGSHVLDGADFDADQTKIKHVLQCSD